MKLAIMGDTHFDFYFKPNSSISEQKFDNKFKKIIELNPADVLILAGDIGHYNAQNLTCLKHLQRYYVRIIVTFGNHDYYLVSKSVLSKYQNKTDLLGGSRERVEEMKSMIDDEEGIDYLDGNVVEIDGVRIGGATGWYDGSLLRRSGKTTDEIQTIWEEEMNDSKLIYPTAKRGARFDDLFNEQKYRLDAVYQNCDIMVSHVSPLAEWEQFAEMYNFQPALDSDTHEAIQEYRAFYCFDGKEYLENGSMTHWIFGHTHRSFRRIYKRADNKEIEIICNSIGYPKSPRIKPTKVFEIQVIEVKK